jgi:hypothetical protein
MKLGTKVKMEDGRIGTVVYNGLDGVGIKWGVHNPNTEDFEGTSGGLFDDDIGPDWPWRPEAMLRESYPSASLPCVGDNYKIIQEDDK